MDLKQSIKSLTGVLPERQKLLGLKVKGKLCPLDPDSNHYLFRNFADTHFAV